MVGRGVDMMGRGGPPWLPGYLTRGQTGGQPDTGSGSRHDAPGTGQPQGMRQARGLPCGPPDTGSRRRGNHGGLPLPKTMTTKRYAYGVKQLGGRPSAGVCGNAVITTSIPRVTLDCMVADALIPARFDKAGSAY